MNQVTRALIIATGLVLSLACTGLPGDASTVAGSSTDDIQSACPAAKPGEATCFALINKNVHGGMGTRLADALPPGYGPADLRAAYQLPATGGSNQTVAIVDAGDDTDAEADLAVYRQTYGLPACTTANGCFHKVNQDGKADPLPADQGWGVEISLDLDLVSAACPDCKILLVESNDPTTADLAAATNTAAGLGATEISNSYGGQENGGDLAYAAAYTHPGVAITASSGDLGYYVPNFPAAYSSVIAVGGTSLTTANNQRGWTESAWGSAQDIEGAASGCSAWVGKPSWQQDPHCSGRTVADISADADPHTGPAVYFGKDGGWIVVGGTSAASPFIAGVIALAGNPQRYPDASYFYAHADELNDVVTGVNGGIWKDCGGDYLCTAGPGYDGPTGLGTPNGIAAF